MHDLNLLARVFIHFRSAHDVDDPLCKEIRDIFAGQGVVIHELNNEEIRARFDPSPALAGSPPATVLSDRVGAERSGREVLARPNPNDLPDQIAPVNTFDPDEPEFELRVDGDALPEPLTQEEPKPRGRKRSLVEPRE